MKSAGQVLFDEVVRKLRLLESDYFDLEYVDVRGVQCWLDHDKPILRQLPRHGLELRFVVKFYTPDPGQLEEEYTRYLFVLQVKRDLVSGAMPCQEHTAILLASYIVQSEFGDYIEGEFGPDPSYSKYFSLLPNHSEDSKCRLMDHHKEHAGQSAAVADYNLLDTARKVELYGIQMHHAKDHEGVALQLSVAHMGVLVFQNLTKINTFSWAKIRKLSFKRKKFLVKLHPEGYGYYKDIVEFYFDSRNACKNFWKRCIEHHAFFRCQSVTRLPRKRPRVVSRGSSFRYSGRTQKQLLEYVRENCTKRPEFHRSVSMRTMSASHSVGATPRSGTLNSRDLRGSRATSAQGGGGGGGGTARASRSTTCICTSMERLRSATMDNGSNRRGKLTAGAKKSKSVTESSARQAPIQSKSLQTIQLAVNAQNGNIADGGIELTTESKTRLLSNTLPLVVDRNKSSGMAASTTRDDFDHIYHFNQSAERLQDLEANRVDIARQNENDDEEDMAGAYRSNLSQDSYRVTDSRDSSVDRLEGKTERRQRRSESCDELTSRPNEDERLESIECSADAVSQPRVVALDQTRLMQKLEREKHLRENQNQEKCDNDKDETMEDDELVVRARWDEGTETQKQTQKRQHSETETVVCVETTRVIHTTTTTTTCTSEYDRKRKRLSRENAVRVIDDDEQLETTTSTVTVEAVSSTTADQSSDELIDTSINSQQNEVDIVGVTDEESTRCQRTMYEPSENDNVCETLLTACTVDASSTQPMDILAENDNLNVVEGLSDAICTNMDVDQVIVDNNVKAEGGEIADVNISTVDSGEQTLEQIAGERCNAVSEMTDAKAGEQTLETRPTETDKNDEFTTIALKTLDTEEDLLFQTHSDECKHETVSHETIDNTNQSDVNVAIPDVAAVIRTTTADTELTDQREKPQQRELPEVHSKQPAIVDNSLISDGGSCQAENVNAIEDIPYVLHKRTIHPQDITNGDQQISTKQTASYIEGYSSWPTVSSGMRSRSPSPRTRPPPHAVVAPPLTREQRKAQLEKVKANLVLMAQDIKTLSAAAAAISSSRSTSASRASTKSPTTATSSRRAFEFVMCNQLPPRDSFSSIDDSVSPSRDRDTRVLMTSRLDAKLCRTALNGGDKESGTRKDGRAEGDAKYGETAEMKQSEDEHMAETTPPHHHADDTTCVADKSSTATVTGTQQTKQLGVQSESGHDSGSEQDTSDSRRLLGLAGISPEVEEDVNRILSDCDDGALTNDEEGSLGSSKVDAAEFSEVRSSTKREESDAAAKHLPSLCVDESQTVEISEPLPTEPGAVVDIDEHFPPPPPWISSADGAADATSFELSSSLQIPEIIVRAASDVDLTSIPDIDMPGGITDDFTESEDIQPAKVAPLVEDDLGSPPEVRRSPTEAPPTVSSVVENTTNQNGNSYSNNNNNTNNNNKDEEAEDDTADVWCAAERQLLNKLRTDDVANQQDGSVASSHSLNDDLDADAMLFTPSSTVRPMTSRPTVVDAACRLSESSADGGLSTVCRHGHVIEWLEEQAQIMRTGNDVEQCSTSGGAAAAAFVISDDEEDLDRPVFDGTLDDVMAALEVEAKALPFHVGCQTSMRPTDEQTLSTGDVDDNELLVCQRDNDRMHQTVKLCSAIEESVVLDQSTNQQPSTSAEAVSTLAMPEKQTSVDDPENDKASTLSISSAGDVEPVRIDDLPDPLEILESEAEFIRHRTSSVISVPPSVVAAWQQALVESSSSGEEDGGNDVIRDPGATDPLDVGDILDSVILDSNKPLSEDKERVAGSVKELKRDGVSVTEDDEARTPSTSSRPHPTLSDSSSSSESSTVPVYTEEPDVLAALDEDPEVTSPRRRRQIDDDMDMDDLIEDDDEVEGLAGDDTDSTQSIVSASTIDAFVHQVMKYGDECHGSRTVGATASQELAAVDSNSMKCVSDIENTTVVQVAKPDDGRECWSVARDDDVLVVQFAEKFVNELVEECRTNCATSGDNRTRTTVQSSPQPFCVQTDNVTEPLRPETVEEYDDVIEHELNEILGCSCSPESSGNTLAPEQQTTLPIVSDQPPTISDEPQPLVERIETEI